MGRKKSASKSQVTFVDEEASLSMIENQEFMAMRAAQKIWLALTTTEDQLRELVSDCLIQAKEIAEWKAPGQHRVPTPGPGEIFLSPLSVLDSVFLLLLFFIDFLVILGLA
jgi:hypothetical protein